MSTSGCVNVSTLLCVLSVKDVGGGRVESMEVDMQTGWLLWWHAAEGVMECTGKRCRPGKWKIGYSIVMMMAE